MTDIICKYCGLVNDYTTTPSGPHLRANCNGCGAYIKFISKEAFRADNHNTNYIQTLPDVQPVNKAMSILINGSLCLTDMIDKAKSGHSAFSRGKNGKVYVAITEWVNDDTDQFGNDVSFLLNSQKDKKETEGKIYIGNGRKSQGTQAEPLQPQQAAAEMDLSGLPF